MGVIEEVRQAFQDFLAPELKAMSAKFDAVEARFDALEKVLEARFKEVDSRFTVVDSRFHEVSIRLQTLQESIDRNDSAQKQLIAKLTQDFEFDKRLTEIEREVRINKSSAA